MTAAAGTLSFRPCATLTFEQKQINQALGDPKKGYIVQSVTFPNQRNVPIGKAPVIRFPLPDAVRQTGIMFEATVDIHSALEGGASICTGKIYNLSKDIISSISPTGIIKVEAGYLDGQPSGKQLIFYGRLNSARAYRQGGETITEFSARAVPNELYDLKPNISLKGLSNVGTVIQLICTAVGLKAGILDQALFGRPDLISHPKWPSGCEALTDYNSGSMSAGEAITKLVQSLSATSAVRFAHIPNNIFPYTVDILDIDRTTGIEEYRILLDSPFVMSAGPASGVKDYGAASHDATQANVLAANIHSITAVGMYRMQTAFDPRMRVGIRVKAKGEFEGHIEYDVQQLTHVIGNDWTTTSQGFLKSGDFYEPIYPYGVQEPGLTDGAQTEA